MSFAEFAASVSSGVPSPSGLSPALEGLWQDGRGEWAAAHRSVQDDASEDGAWVHAYLHRKEGDLGNADYWYRRARRKRPGGGTSLRDEWEQIVRALLAPDAHPPAGSK